MRELLTSPAAIAIVVGEILFWVLLAAGLAARYLLRAPRLGLALLGGTVLVDLGILMTAVIDVRSGSVATSAHGLAALYIGLSVAFGHSLIRWADGHAAHRWAGAPRPHKVPNAGPERAAHEWRTFARWLLAGAIAAGALGLVILVGGPDARVDALLDWFPRLLLITGIWFATGPLWHLGSRAEPARTPEPTRSR